jgi:hypothetical protein
MDAKELADKIVDIVDAYGDCTHGMMIKHLGDVVIGDCDFGSIEHNIFFVVGGSEVLCDALVLLDTEKPSRTEPGLCSFFTALYDGTPIARDMPVLKKPPTHGYKKPRHYPLRLVPCGSSEARIERMNLATWLFELPGGIPYEPAQNK